MDVQRPALATLLLLLGGCCTLSAPEGPLRPADGSERRLQLPVSSREAAIAQASQNMKAQGAPVQSALGDLGTPVPVAGGQCYVVAVRLDAASQLSEAATSRGIDLLVHLNAPAVELHGVSASGVAENPKYQGVREGTVTGPGGVVDIGCLAEGVELIPAIFVHDNRDRAIGQGAYTVEVFGRRPSVEEAATAAAHAQSRHQASSEEAARSCATCREELTLCLRRPSDVDGRTQLEVCRERFRKCLWPLGTQSCPLGE